MINAAFCFFTHLLLVFLVSIFDARRYDSAYLGCANVPRPGKFTAFINESVEKIKQIQAHGRVLKSYLKPQGEDIYIFKGQKKIHYFCVMFRFAAFSNI